MTFDLGLLKQSKKGNEKKKKERKKKEMMKQKMTGKGSEKPTDVLLLLL